ncbi:MAG: hypothetical protein AB7I34_11130 [Rhizobiaceae bacterium]
MQILFASLLTLAGCQSTPPDSAPAAPQPAAPGPAPEATGDKVGTCTARAAAQFSAPAEDVATSNEYPFNDGAAIDGSVTAGGGIKQFRCEFDRAGAFLRVSLLPAA